MKLRIALFSLLLGLSLQAQHRIFYLIANPRASLVHFLRMVGNRGDMKVIHIPANWAYCHEHNYLAITEGWYRKDAPATYEAAKRDILKEAEKSSVFVGENTHTAIDFLTYNSTFIKDPRVSFIFLLCNPHSSIISYYKKKVSYFDELPESQLSASMGFKDLYTLYKELIKHGITPVIIKTEDLFLVPEKTINSFCQQLNIPFIEAALHWKDLSKGFKNFSDSGWYTIENTDCALHWHLNAIKSTGFNKLAAYGLDEQNAPTFEEISKPEHRRICIQAYKENIKYYNLLVEQA